MRIFITGGAGFMGSNMIHFLLRQPNVERVVNLDKLTYAGNLENLSTIALDRRYEFVRGDIADPETVNALFKKERPDIILNYAAETHVDRSLYEPMDFLKTAVEGTYYLLEAARQYGCWKFVQISTDEVYGSVPVGETDEEARFETNSPYSAAKGAGDLLCRAYYTTYRVPVVVTHSCNYYGPYQYPEKVIPLFITNLLEGKKVPLYGQGQNVREWIFTEDHCGAILTVMARGVAGEVYNIGTEHRVSNVELTNMVLQLMGKDDSYIEYVPDRPGHDLRYALDSSKIRRELGWKPRVDFMTGMMRTIGWYRANEEWWRPLKEGAKAWYQKNYVERT